MTAVEAIRPASVEALQAAVRENARVLPIGGGSKPALSTARDGVVPISLSSLAGVVEYDPGEFVFTALAGTPVAEVDRILGQNDQYLPFDPPLVERGATLGGTVAAGLSGPGRCRHGGVRDFVLGVRFVSATGEIVRGRGRVVKNAAGFDLPKLMVGSLGELGFLLELSFKVLPRPAVYATVELMTGGPGEALEMLARLSRLAIDLDALDIVVAPASVRLLVRIGGLEGALPPRLDRLRTELGGGDVLRGPEDEAVWRDAREFAWLPPGWSLTKVPITPGRIPALEEQLRDGPTLRRYAGRGQVVWIASPGAAAELDAPLRALGQSGLAILGPAGQRRLGVRIGASFEDRVRRALDPHGRFAASTLQDGR